MLELAFNSNPNPKFLTLRRVTKMRKWTSPMICSDLTAVIMEKRVTNSCDVVTVTTVDTGNANVLKQFVQTFF